MQFITSSMNIFIFFVIISFTMDNLLFQCNFPSLFSFISNFIHHIISTYIWFGSFIFGKYFYHLLFLCIVLLLQYFFNWDCPVTLEYNKQCGFSKKSGHKDIFYFINKPFFNHVPYYSFYILLILYDVYNLLIHNKIKLIFKEY